MELAVLKESLERLAPASVPKHKLSRATGRGAGMQGNALAIEPVPTGYESLDQSLLLGGLPAGRITEIAGAPSSGKTSLTLGLLATQTQAGRLVAYVDGSGEFYPPAAAAMGVQLDHLLLLRPSSTDCRSRKQDPAAALARATEILSRCRAFSMIALDLPGRVRMQGLPARRIRGAAQATGTTLVVMSRSSQAVEGASARIEARGHCRSRDQRSTEFSILKGGRGMQMSIELSQSSHRFDHCPGRSVAPVLYRKAPGEEPQSPVSMGRSHSGARHR